MLQEQVIPIDFGQGLDTKTDPKSVVAGKFLRLENGVFTNFKRIAKRNGYTALGSLTNPVLSHSFNNELIVQDSGYIKSWSPNLNTFISKGPYLSLEVAKQPIEQEYPVSGLMDNVVSGNYSMFAWSTAPQTDTSFTEVTSSVYVSFVDNSTGTVIYGPSVLVTMQNGHNLYNGPFCVLLGGSVFAVIYMANDGSSLQCTRFQISGGAVSILGTTTISSGLFNSTYGAIYSIEQTSTGACLAYFTSNGYKVSLINTSGAVTATSTNVLASVAYLLVKVNAISSQIFIYIWQSSNRKFLYRVYDSSLSTVVGETAIVTLASGDVLSNAAAYDLNSTQQVVFYGHYIQISAASRNIDYTQYITVKNDGTIGSATLFTNGAFPSSRIISYNSSYYCIFLYRGPLDSSTPSLLASEPTFFLVRLYNNYTSAIEPFVVARFAAGDAFSDAWEFNTIAFSPNLTFLNSNKFQYACGVLLQQYLTDYFEVNQQFSIGAYAGGFSYTFDFASQNSYAALNAGNNAILNGGLLQMYDGRNVCELNFNMYPEIIGLVQATTSGGAVANGTYSYIAIFQWIDAQGNLHQSAPSIAKSITTSGGNNSVNIYVTSNYLSQKNNTSVAIYRSQASGAIYYLVTDPVYLTNADGSTNQYITYTDLLADASLPGNPNPYTFPGSSVLENSTPPPSVALSAHNNRLWFVNSENKNEIWYTKSYQQGTGLSPSGFMVQQIDPKFGDIVALSEMDEKLVMFKQTGAIFQSGDGVNDTGNGSTLSFPQIIPSAVGCSVMKSIALIPKGLMFKSLNGIYLLDRSLNISYIGAEVESYNSQVITGSTLVPGKSQIRFLCSSGLTLVYDYIFNQWSTFTSHTGNSSAVWNSTYVYSTGSALFQETSGTYTDNGSAFSLLAQTSWLALASIQGFQRVKRLIMLGDFINGNSASHNLSISAAYDFSTTFQTAITYAFGAISASGFFQYRERLPQQKCSTISLLIQETTTGSSAEYIDLTNISFEAGVKKGLNKLGGLKSVG